MEKLNKVRKDMQKQRSLIPNGMSMNESSVPELMRSERESS